MEGCCSLHSSALNLVPSSSSIPRINALSDKPFLHNHLLKFPNSKRDPNLKSFKFLPITAQASVGTTKLSSETSNATPKDSKDENLAFVAGATGRVGSRLVRELLKLGFQVRAGVRSPERAKPLVESVKQMKMENAGGETQFVEKLEIVQCDLEKKDQIVGALGNASVVICCIGASEKEVFDISGPYRIDYLATKNLVEAATVAKVDHFILLTSLGTNKVGFPAAILNLFWGVLLWKRKAEEALIASGIPYTIVRPGGMERPTDTFKETHNTTLSQQDTLFGGLVSNLQVAELMASMAKNRDLSYCKVVEVVAETTAPLTPVEELLKTIPSDRPGSFPPKESGVVVEPDLPPPKSEEPKPSAVTEHVKPDEITPQPQSPYTAYEDLKPPTSPTPTPSTTPGATPTEASTPTASEEVSKTVIEEDVKTEVKKGMTLSPYSAYEDLKPPSSPSPTPPGGRKSIPLDASKLSELASPSSESNEVAELVIDSVAENGPPKISSYYLSPYPAYDELKPPTSPSPSAPNVTITSTPLAVDSSTPVQSSVQLPVEEKTEIEEQDHVKPKPRPLSPFTMYEDLKPPVSPSPSSPSSSKF
ncbi:hypothetical protein CsatB_018222 [Cannabis sativa]